MPIIWRENKVKKKDVKVKDGMENKVGVRNLLEDVWTESRETDVTVLGV